MSKYTTGEIAKLCGVSVRTVQYYDSRGILVPCQLSEGGRRLYADEDLQKLKVICFLREIGLPIHSISQLLSEEHPEDVLTLLLAQQQETLRTEIAKQQESLDKLHELQAALRRTSHFSVASIGDIAHTMENKKKLRKLRMYLILVGIPLNFIEMSTLILWIWKGIWQPFVFCALIAIVIGVVAAWLYSKNTAYICPHCHAMFIPAFKNMLLARHTPNTRKLTCTVCGYHGFCVETYRKEEDSHA